MFGQRVDPLQRVLDSIQQRTGNREVQVGRDGRLWVVLPNQAGFGLSVENGTGRSFTASLWRLDDTGLIAFDSDSIGNASQDTSETARRALSFINGIASRGVQALSTMDDPMFPALVNDLLRVAVHTAVMLGLWDWTGPVLVQYLYFLVVTEHYEGAVWFGDQHKETRMDPESRREVAKVVAEAAAKMA